MTETREGTQPSDIDFAAIEKKWQAYWLSHKTFKTNDTFDKPKYYILDMFPYPSGDGLHVGHPEGYTATDVLARYKRMRGFNVLHPMGWDAFGLPAEQHAMRTGTHPRDTTVKNIKRFREQIRSLGLSYDWDREVDTTDPKYYRWTQWIFLKLYERGLAYESHAPVNWCPELGTVLANEEVIDGKSEIGGHPVIKRPMRQWVLKITEYAERLLSDLESLDWPEAIKEQQRNWIGKSVGANIVFDVADHPGETVEVFTTRPDTLFGATFLVLAPEHPLVTKVTTSGQRAKVDAYVEETARRSDRDRIAATEKTGCFTGGHALHPVTKAKLPIYISDYVLISYGKGAIMAVPAHDQRDHDFARRFGLEIKRVLTGGKDDIQEEAHEGEGTLVASDFLDGLAKDAAIERMCTWLEDHHKGERAVTYKLRDWLFSRQRYWGEPFPLVRDHEGRVHELSENELPVLLPSLDEFKPAGNGEPPLSLAKDWLKYRTPDGGVYERETNTMPQWAGSCWYFLRFIDPRNEERAWDPEKERYWMPVDLYVGGAEHAVLHLLYARFWHKVLFDAGFVSTKEPFQRLVNQGMILGENGEKMSKSRGNVVNPDDVIAEWGADSMRLYEMFMGPLEASKPWNTSGISGCHRFLRRVARFFFNDDGSAIAASATAAKEPESNTKALHRTIKKVSEDLDGLRFNTAIAAMMEFVNTLYKQPELSRGSTEAFVLLLSPFAPHLAEELWQKLGHAQSLAYEPWPSYDPALVVDDQITVSVQVNGKLRGTVSVGKTTPQADVIAAAKALETVAKYLDGATIRKEIFVPGKIVNFVVG